MVRTLRNTSFRYMERKEQLVESHMGLVHSTMKSASAQNSLESRQPQEWWLLPLLRNELRRSLFLPQSVDR